jgi:hypothetical protein
MSDTSKKLREMEAEGRAIDERIRRATEAQRVTTQPLRIPADVRRDRRAAPGRTR